MSKTKRHQYYRILRVNGKRLGRRLGWTFSDGSCWKARGWVKKWLHHIERRKLKAEVCVDDE